MTTDKPIRVGAAEFWLRATPMLIWAAIFLGGLWIMSQRPPAPPVGDTAGQTNLFLSLPISSEAAKGGITVGGTAQLCRKETTVSEVTVRTLSCDGDGAKQVCRATVEISLAKASDVAANLKDETVARTLQIATKCE